MSTMFWLERWERKKMEEKKAHEVETIEPGHQEEKKKKLEGGKKPKIKPETQSNEKKPKKRWEETERCGESASAGGIP